MIIIEVYYGFKPLMYDLFAKRKLFFLFLFLEVIKKMPLKRLLSGIFYLKNIIILIASLDT